MTCHGYSCLTYAMQKETTLLTARWELRTGFMKWFSDLEEELNIHMLFAKVLHIYEHLLQIPLYRHMTLQQILDPSTTEKWVQKLISHGHDVWFVQCLYIALYHIDRDFTVRVSPSITYMNKELFTTKC